MINVIVATHGPLADALLASGRMVYGELPHVYPVTLSEQAGIEGFKATFSQVLTSAGKDADGVLVLCDMQSGTPWNRLPSSFFFTNGSSRCRRSGGQFPDAVTKRGDLPFNGCSRRSRRAVGADDTHAD